MASSRLDRCLPDTFEFIQRRLHLDTELRIDRPPLFNFEQMFRPVLPLPARP